MRRRSFLGGIPAVCVPFAGCSVGSPGDTDPDGSRADADTSRATAASGESSGSPGPADPSYSRPESVSPGGPATTGEPPSDAEILFGGESLGDWESADGGPADWTVADGYFEVEPGSGDIRTTDAIGDCQLHVEWRPPAHGAGDGQQRGNSGVFLMDRYEFQVLDGHENETYADGMAGAYYGQSPPLVNPARQSGEWAEYDVVWRGPRFEGGELARPATATVFLNGVAVQTHLDADGPTTASGPGPYETHPPEAPLRLQDHGDRVRFRNVWYRPLPEAAIDPGDAAAVGFEGGAYATSGPSDPADIAPGGPSTTGDPPSDATVLLDGGELDGWETADGDAPDWSGADGFVELGPTTDRIRSTAVHDDCQLHVEWRTPVENGEFGENHGAAGLLLLDRYEFQLRDSEESDSEPDRWAGAYTDQAPPLASALRGAGEWQQFDLVWEGPRFGDDDSLSRPARATVLLNGVAVQVRLYPDGPNHTGSVDDYEPHSPDGPLGLRIVGEPVRFRTIWYRSLK